MREFPVNDWAYTALVDTEDFDFLDRWLWSILLKNGKPTYVRRIDNKIHKTYYMHKVIAERMGLDTSGQIDHKDRNPLNNCRSNLREATASQNNANRPRPKNAKHPYRGIAEDVRWTNTWYAFIKVNGIQENLGTYKSAEAAARAYDRRAKEVYGEFAQLNFP